MKETNQVAVEQSLEEYVNGMKKYCKGSALDVQMRFMRALRDYHPYEGLLKKKSGDSSVWIITPRGIDYFQEVLMKLELEQRFAKSKRTEMEKRKLMDALDLKWTEKWISILFDGEKTLDDFLIYKDGSMRAFEENYGVTLKRLEHDRKRKSEIKECLLWKDRKWFIKKESFKTFVMEFYYKDFAKRVSKELRAKCKRLEKVLPYIRIQEFPELTETKYRVKQIKKKAEDGNRPVLVAWDSQRMQSVQPGDLKKIKEVLHEFHPHEVMLYKEPNAKENEKDKLYFTAYGYDWYANVFRPKMRMNSPRKDLSGWVETEDVFMKRALRAEKVGWDEGLSDDWNSMMDIYAFRSTEFMQRILQMVGIEKELADLKKEDFEKLEESMPTYRIRRYSFLFSKTKRYKKGQMQYEMEKPEEKKNREWLEVHDLKNGWYRGRILNRNYYTGNGLFSILVLPIQLENGKKMKMRIPNKLFEDSAIQNLFVPEQKLRLEIEEVEVDGTKHKRVKWFVLGEQILVRLDWNLKSPMWYVPRPKIGGQKKENNNQTFIKQEYKNYKKPKSTIKIMDARKRRKLVKNKKIQFLCSEDEYNEIKKYSKEKGISMNLMIYRGLLALQSQDTLEVKNEIMSLLLQIENLLQEDEINTFEKNEIKKLLLEIKKLQQGVE